MNNEEQNKLEELKKLIQEGIDSFEKDGGIPFEVAMENIKKRRALGARLDPKNTGRTIIRRDNEDEGK